MVTSESITKNEVLAALNDETLAEQIIEKMKENLENDRNSTIEVARSVAEHILNDLDSFLDMHV